MIYCGIDPGNTGAIAIFEGIRVIAIIDMPTEPKPTGKGFQTHAGGLEVILGSWSIKYAFVEKVHAMPGQGVTSMFTFGRGLGVIEGVTAALGIKVFLVPPQTWKKEFGLLGADKDACRIKVINNFPSQKDNFKLKKHIGRADAFLIGLYGRKKL